MHTFCQCGETDLHFITSLYEEEGIYFYFEHTENSHCLCFLDREPEKTANATWFAFNAKSGDFPVYAFSGTEKVCKPYEFVVDLVTANSFTHYRCLLVPRLWFMNQISDHRIYQQLSVVQIID
jgi:uncharacterized protein involved in type VI secretion and phage assembly